MPLVNIGPGFYNIRAPFKVAAGLIDVGTHMSICRLTNGNYLVIDTVNLDAQLKSEIDALTNGGSKIQAVVATHPFHTLAFRGFYSHYPNAKYYGTPRHLRVIPEIPWVGDLQCPKTRALWEPDVFMRIPAGSEFVDPKPELSNHFSNVFVYHVEVCKAPPSHDTHHRTGGCTLAVTTAKPPVSPPGWARVVSRLALRGRTVHCAQVQPVECLARVILCLWERVQRRKACERKV